MQDIFDFPLEIDKLEGIDEFNLQELKEYIEQRIQTNQPIKQQQFENMIYQIDQGVLNELKILAKIVNSLLKSNVNIIKDLKDNADGQRFQSKEFIRRLNHVKYSIFLTCKMFIKMLNVQSKKQEIKSQKTKNDFMIKYKIAIFENLVLTLEKLSEIIKQFNQDERMLNHLIVLGFLILLEADLYKDQENKIIQYFYLLIDKFQAERSKFVISFTQLEENEMNNYKTEIRAKILSELLDEDKTVSSKDCVKDTFEKFLGILNTKIQEIEYLKNFKQFLVQFSRIQPEYIYNNYNMFRYLYSNESYIVRNSLTETMPQLLLLLFKKMKNIDTAYMNDFQNTLEDLLKRHQDKNQYCRNSMLKQFQIILDNKLLDLQQKEQLVKILSNRIQDITQLVRRRALDILHRLILELQNEFSDIEQKKQMVIENSEQNNPNSIYNVTILKIYQELQNITTYLKNHLNSKYQEDIIGSLKTIVAGNAAKIPEFKNIYFYSFNLIWNKEPLIKDKVQRTFYIQDVQNKNELQLVEGLQEVYNKIDPNYKPSFEEIIRNLFENNLKPDPKDDKLPRIHFSISKTLWNQFNQYKNTEKEKSYFYLIILRILVKYKKTWLKNNMKSIMDIFQDYKNQNYIDWNVILEIINMFINSENQTDQENKNLLLKIVVTFILKYQGIRDSKYFNVLQKLIQFGFQVRNDPDKFSDFLIKKMSLFINKNIVINDFFESQEKNKSQLPIKNQNEIDYKQGQKLIHLLFAVGEVAFRFIYYFEKIDKELQKKKNQKLTNEANDELQRALGGADAEYENEKMTLQNIINQILEEDSLLYEFYLITKELIKKELKNQQPSNDLLLITSTNTMIKFMLVNEKITIEMLPTILQLLEHKQISDYLKSNVIIGIGDLFHQFPNIIKHELDSIYIFLTCNSNSLKKTTINVISRLLLNDYLKINQGVIFNFVKLLIDKNSQIKENIKYIFGEIHNKEPEVFSNMISNLINKFSQSNEISEIDFEEIIKFLIDFIEKDTQICNLMEFLILQLKGEELQKKILYTMICVSFLTIEKSVKILFKNSDILKKIVNFDERIKNMVEDIIKKIKKFQKIERVKIEEFKFEVFGQDQKIQIEIKKEEIQSQQSYTEQNLKFQEEVSSQQEYLQDFNQQSSNRKRRSKKQQILILKLIFFIYQVQFFLKKNLQNQSMFKIFFILLLLNHNINTVRICDLFSWVTCNQTPQMQVVEQSEQVQEQIIEEIVYPCQNDSEISAKLEILFKNNQKLGEGFTGQVFGWRNKAVKKMIATNLQIFEQQMNEVKIMKENYFYPHLMGICNNCCYYSLNEESNKYIVYLIMDKKLGNLGEYKYNKNFSWKTSRLWKVDMMIRMARSVFTFHENGYLHTDLKLENFLMDNDFYPILADFGFSFKYQDFLDGNWEIQDVTGTENYFPPELEKELRKNQKPAYSFKSDIYSLGVCFFLISIEEDYIVSVKDLQTTMVNAPNTSLPDIKKQYYIKYFGTLINKMIEENPNDRPELNDILLDLYKIKSRIIEDVKEERIKRKNKILEQIQSLKELGIDVKPKDPDFKVKRHYVDNVRITDKDFYNDHSVYEYYFKYQLKAFANKKNKSVIYDFMYIEKVFLEQSQIEPEKLTLIIKFLGEAYGYIYQQRQLMLNVPLLRIAPLNPFFNLSKIELIQEQIIQDTDKISQGLQIDEQNFDQEIFPDQLDQLLQKNISEIDQRLRNEDNQDHRI